MIRECSIAFGMAFVTTQADASELVVNVTGIKSSVGEVGCALHASAAQFPTGNSGTMVRWQKANSEGVVCRFSGLRAGAYAVAVSHDLNGNRKTDTNLLGMPTEDWGVTNNVRPSLRAPTFEEAKVSIPETGAKTVTVRLGR